MINLQPLIEKFKKAVYGRDVRQSIVDLAQAIGDNHNEQETLRYEVKTLNADTKEENKQGKEYITTKKAELDDAITAGKTSIESTVSTGKSELDSKINTGIGQIGTKTSQGEQAVSVKTQSGISSLEQKITESTQTLEAVISRASESKVAVDTAITKAGESKTALESTIQQSETGKITLDATIQQSAAKDQELENHIAEIKQIIAGGKAVTKRDLNEVKSLISPQILALDTGDFIWYISAENIKFYSINTDETEKAIRAEAHCNIKLSDVKEQIKRDGANLARASLDIAGWDRLMANNIPFITPDTQAFVNIAGLKEARLFSTELKENSVNVCWESSKDEALADARIFVKLVTFY